MINFQNLKQRVKIITAFDSFKGTISAKYAGELFETAVKKYGLNADIINIPLADGGEGTIEVLKDSLKGDLIKIPVMNPLLQKITAQYLTWNNCALIEMAQASGLTLVKQDHRDPKVATSYGTGELIKDAVINRGIRNIFITLGGSATNDCGIGVLDALGVIFKDCDGSIISNPVEEMLSITEIDFSNMSKELYDTKFTLLTDVDNPLLGLNGATYTFAQQKGATTEMLPFLETRIAKFATLLNSYTKSNFINAQGAGAAGGVGFALMSVLGAKQQLGINSIMKMLNFTSYLDDAYLVVTGEGCLDGQSVRGKVVSGVAQVAKSHNVPCAVIAGCICDGFYVLYQQGLTTAVSLTTNFESKEIIFAKVDSLFLSAAHRLLAAIGIGISSK